MQWERGRWWRGSYNFGKNRKRGVEKKGCADESLAPLYPPNLSCGRWNQCVSSGVEGWSGLGMLCGEGDGRRKEKEKNSSYFFFST